MPAIPCPTNLWQNERDLYQLLLSCQAKLQNNREASIFSFVQAIETVDPLVALHKFLCPKQRHFYWENPKQQIAIASIGAVIYQEINSADRFLKVRDFIHHTRQNIVKINVGKNLSNSPYFFSSFTFFDAPSTSNSSFSSATVFLPELQIVTKQGQSFLIANFNLDQQFDLQISLDKIQEILYKLSWLTNIFPTPVSNYSPHISPTSSSTTHFKNAVASALQAITDNHLSKIVLAHSLDVIAVEPFDFIHSLNNLRQKHPDCYIFSTSNKQGDTFIGASPERLISIQNQQLTTDALAGSAPRGKTPQEDTILAKQLLHSEKEKREHQAVREFLIQRLEKLGLQPQQSSLQLLQLANIQHLWTPITAQLTKLIDPLEIVAQLHPTPAVAGVPTKTACEQIRLYENFDRGLYAAPLGWVDGEGNSEFIVGIRSALIKYYSCEQGNYRARLYAGAGIVAGSNPGKELAEVELKLQTLLKSLV